MTRRGEKKCVIPASIAEQCAAGIEPIEVTL